MPGDGKTLLKAALAFGLCLAAAGPAAAQTVADDWERTDIGNDVRAVLALPDAPAFTVTCSSGQLVVLVTGLPSAVQADRTRGVFIRRGDQTLSMPWIASAGTEALAGAPRPVARALRRGGRITLSVPGQTQYDLDLPVQSAAVADVMARCDTPLEDPRDALPALDYTGMTWGREPVPSLPDRIRQNGLAVVSCVTTDNGHLRNCVIESEFPVGFEMGRTALQAYRIASVRRLDRGPVPDGHLLTAAVTVRCQRCRPSPRSPLTPPGIGR